MITIPTNLIERTQPQAPIITFHSGVIKTHVYSRSTPMQQQQQQQSSPELNFHHHQGMNNEYMMNDKLQPYFINENDSMNMTPLENSLLYQENNHHSFNFSHPQQQNNWSEKILQDIIGILHILSPTGKILYCSASCIELIGYHPQELIGKSLTDFLHVDDLDIFSKNFQLSFNTLERIKVHYRIRRKDNTYLLLESIGQPKQDIPDQSPQSFFAIAQPYLPKSNGLLDSFLEVKMENEWLKKKLNDMMITQGASPVSVTDHSMHSTIQQYPQQQQFNIRQDYPNNNNNLTSNHYPSNHHQSNRHPSNRNPSNRNNGNYGNHDHQGDYNHKNFQYYTQYSSSSSNHNELLLGPQNYNNDSPQQQQVSSRRPSSCSSSTMFQINNTTTTPAATTVADDNINNATWSTEGGGYSPSVASSSEVNDMMIKYKQEENIVCSDGGLATTSSYMSSNNSTTTVHTTTDIAKKEKWKRRKKNRGTDDYVCADCGTTASPEWRKGPHGPKTLCNACGLRWAKKNKKI